MKYIPVIGMEVHAELKTKSKMFCGCKNGLGLEKEPNVHICPVCTGQPGALPVPNREAIEAVQKVGLALNCTIRLQSKFDRKNYFYPDLPKGYQISQYDEPFCEAGTLKALEKDVRITRIHLEEDTGKLTHATGNEYTLVDYNRSSVPLMELVTEPDIESGKEARAFCQRLRQVLRVLNVSDADMEKGQMRCEVNISLHAEDAPKLSGTKVEIKNLNSFRSVERAVEYEIKRQTEALEAGEKIVQETRGWDDTRGTTVSQRKKESAHDYRYFPEPDIPPLTFTEDYVENLRRHLPELPRAKESRFIEEYGVTVDEAMILVDDQDFAEYFEQVMSELAEKKASGEVKAELTRTRKLAVNYLLTELKKHTKGWDWEVLKQSITPENFAELMGILADGVINSSAAQMVLEAMEPNGDNDPSHIIERLDLVQLSDAGELDAIVSSVLEKNQKSIDDYKAGKQNALQFLMGQVMKETKGKANPQIVLEVLQERLKS